MKHRNQCYEQPIVHLKSQSINTQFQKYLIQEVYKIPQNLTQSSTGKNFNHFFKENYPHVIFAGIQCIQKQNADITKFNWINQMLTWNPTKEATENAAYAKHQDMEPTTATGVDLEATTCSTESNH